MVQELVEQSPHYLSRGRGHSTHSEGSRQHVGSHSQSEGLWFAGACNRVLGRSRQLESTDQQAQLFEWDVAATWECWCFHWRGQGIVQKVGRWEGRASDLAHYFPLWGLWGQTPQAWGVGCQRWSGGGGANDCEGDLSGLPRRDAEATRLHQHCVHPSLLLGFTIQTKPELIWG